jgi:GxxExxY protein
MLKTQEEYEQTAKLILNSCFEVHKELGAGLFESVYEFCLIEELRSRRLNVKNQVKLPVVYKGRTLEKEFIIDLLIEDAIVIELKSVEELMPIHEVQLVNYMKLANKRLGFLINFNVSQMKDGIRRKVNNYYFS